MFFYNLDSALFDKYSELSVGFKELEISNEKVDVSFKKSQDFDPISEFS